MSGPNLIVFDCDSTLSSIEGIDELARVRGPEVFKAVEAMTNAAMDGSIPVESVFARRLEIIQPRAEHLALVGQRYLETIEPTAVETVQTLRSRGWTPVILSGGFRAAIRPLADRLEIARVEAVDLRFDPDTGAYAGFDEAYPTTRSGGKPEVIRRLRQEVKPFQVVMVGDGMSDVETLPEVTLFVGFGRYVERPRVRAAAPQFIDRLDALLPLLAPLE